MYTAKSGGGGGPGRERREEAWKENQDFRQGAQKVCRQSRRVRGVWRRSVQMEQVSSASREIAGPGLVEVDIVRQVRARHPRTRECG